MINTTAGQQGVFHMLWGIVCIGIRLQGNRVTLNEEWDG